MQRRQPGSVHGRFVQRHKKERSSLDSKRRFPSETFVRRETAKNRAHATTQENPTGFLTFSKKVAGMFCIEIIQKTQCHCLTHRLDSSREDKVLTLPACLHADLGRSQPCWTLVILKKERNIAGPCMCTEMSLQRRETCACFP